jgi:regulator of replication initiation timing
MKIEIGESLLLSWLKHIKECQLVQTNWKVSSKWELKHKEILEQLMYESSKVFEEKYGYNLYKGNSGISQVLTQAEIDVVGISLTEKEKHIYAIDVAFHEAGLNYGTKEETVTRVIKKCVRTAMCIYGYLDTSEGTIIFTSPKINPAITVEIDKCVSDIEMVLLAIGLNFKIRIIANEDFSAKILEPILNVIGDVADTSELFMRSLQMYNLFAGKRSKRENEDSVNPVQKRISLNCEDTEVDNAEGLEEMKIGVIVRTVLQKILEDNKVTKEEIERMQTKEYSKETFDIQYPLLQKASLTDGKSPKRYYASPIKIYGETFYMCSEWFEVPANNDRPFLLKWLALHKENK